jgi:hypothetical protein
VSLSKFIDNNWPAIVAGLFAVAALSLGLLSFERSAIAIPPIPSRDSVRPPFDWLSSANPKDVLRVPMYRVAYWGRPDVPYGTRVTREASRPVGVVIHYTRRIAPSERWPNPSLRFVQYQHNGDKSRGGSYGYHVYVSRSGEVIQGAPLSKRTNHIKPKGHRLRSKVGANLDGSNAIGVGATGACKLKADVLPKVRCAKWEAPPRQEAAIIASVKAIQKRFGIPCKAVYGHGELQMDRRNFEGTALAKKLREKC